jgi:hypothetical protein
MNTRTKQPRRTTRKHTDDFVSLSAPFEKTLVEPFATQDETLTENGETFAALFSALRLLRQMPASFPLERARELIDRVAQTGNARLSWLALSRSAYYTRPKTRAILVENILASETARFAALALHNGNGLNKAQKRSLMARARQDPGLAIHFVKEATITAIP